MCWSTSTSSSTQANQHHGMSCLGIRDIHSILVASRHYVHSSSYLRDTSRVECHGNGRYTANSTAESTCCSAGLEGEWITVGWMWTAGQSLPVLLDTWEVSDDHLLDVLPGTWCTDRRSWFPGKRLAGQPFSSFYLWTFWKCEQIADITAGRSLRKNLLLLFFFMIAVYEPTLLSTCS